MIRVRGSSNTIPRSLSSWPNQSRTSAQLSPFSLPLRAIWGAEAGPQSTQVKGKRSSHARAICAENRVLTSSFESRNLTSCTCVNISSDGKFRLVSAPRATNFSEEAQCRDFGTHLEFSARNREKFCATIVRSCKNRTMSPFAEMSQCSSLRFSVSSLEN